MIVVALRGGLGNQMFQYAFAFALAKRWNVPLKIDLGPLSKDNKITHNTPREFALGIFGIASDHASEHEIAVTRGDINYKRGFLQKIIRAFLFRLGYNWHWHIQSNNLGFESSLAKAFYPTYLYGHWQSERYFTSCKQEIRDLFRFKEQVTVSGQHWAKEIFAASSPVGIHVRRGDYVTAENAGFHGLCSLEYYQQAIHLIASRDSLATFFFFSDDINWAKENVQVVYPSFYVDGYFRPNWEDMYLMSLCKHHIIANSTFSWWSAWLGTKSDNGIVVAPKKWLATESHSATDIVPVRWLKL